MRYTSFVAESDSVVSILTNNLGAITKIASTKSPPQPFRALPERIVVLDKRLLEDCAMLGFSRSIVVCSAYF